MARFPRIVIPGQALHIIQRGNNRQPCFFADDDYRYYLDSLKEAAVRCGAQVHAYVLMTNHVHLLLTPESVQTPSLLLQSVGRRYVRYVNHGYRRSGTLWEGRYKSTLIDSDRYLLTCSRYIELNPVRARMVGRPGDYIWSSFRSNTGGPMEPILRRTRYTWPWPTPRKIGRRHTVPCLIDTSNHRRYRRFGWPPRRVWCSAMIASKSKCNPC